MDANINTTPIRIEMLIASTLDFLLEELDVCGAEDSDVSTVEDIVLVAAVSEESDKLYDMDMDVNDGDAPVEAGLDECEDVGWVGEEAGPVD